MEDSKKDGKKKGAKPRPDGLAESAWGADTARSLSSLHDRFSALTFEITALRADLSGSGKTGKPKRGAGEARTVPDVPVAEGVALTQTATSEHAATGDTVIVVRTGFVQVPVHSERMNLPTANEDVSSDAPVFQTVTLRLVPDAAQQSDRREEREGTLIERAARLAASLAAPPRVRIARLLLTEGTLTATELGTGADLTTGSLYHHLREMTHAGVLCVVSRNRYALTDTGRRALLPLLALAHDAP